MREIRYDSLNETIYAYTVAKRLQVYHVHKPDASKTFVSARVPLGSVHEGYKEADGTVRHVPRGVAHFLEHTMFEKDGEDLSKAFAREEASINAFTDHHGTTYLFSATANVESHALRLLDMLFHPEFTKKTVEKEKKIITEELNMHKDDPFYLQYRGLMNNLYTTHPLKDEILGSAESIGAMEVSHLKRMHSAYYDPSRVKLVVVGNIAPRALKTHLENTLAMPRESGLSPLAIRRETVRNVNTAYEKADYDIKTPSLMMGIKLASGIYAASDPIRMFLTHSIATEALLGSTSPLYEDLLEQTLVNDAYDVDVVFEPSYANILVFAETDDPDTLRRRLKSTIETEAPKGLDAASFTRVKRRMIGQFIRTFDSSERLAGEIADHLQFDVLYHDLVTVLEAITKEEADRALRNLDTDALSFFAAIPKA